MHVNEINKAVMPVIGSFPYGKLFFNGQWLESYSFDREEIMEFETVNDTHDTNNVRLMNAAGYCRDENGKEMVIYTIYGYEGTVYFLTVDKDGEFATYDFARQRWLNWKEGR